MKEKQTVGFIAPLLLFVLAIATQAQTFYLLPDGQMNDDAAYVLRAMKMARPEEFSALWNPAHFSAGWPLLLTPFFVLFDQFYFVGRVVATVITGLTAVLLYFMFSERSGSRRFGFGVAVLFLQAPQILLLGSSLMAEPLNFLLVGLCLYLTTRIDRPWQSLLLGVLVTWCVITRMESVLVVGVVTIALWRRSGFSGSLAGFLAGFVTSFGVNIWLSDKDPGAHSIAIFDIFLKLSPAELATYPLRYLEANSRIVLYAVFGSLPDLALVTLLLLPIAAFYSLRRAGFRASIIAVLADPVVLWVWVFPVAMVVWPYFAPRYWPLWAVVSLALAANALPSKVRAGVLIFLLSLQLPGSVNDYRKGPVARKFQTQVYLPYYRSLGRARKVMTLNAARVETLARVPTTEPLTRTDFQSIPIGMAYMDCRVIEWTNSSHQVAFDGSEVRAYPPHTLEGLRRSTLFEPFELSAYSESYQLIAEPAALMEAGNLYSRAMQTGDGAQRLDLLRQALNLVGDLPEARLAFGQALLEANPQSVEGKEVLESLYQQYPFLNPTGAFGH